MMGLRVRYAATCVRIASVVSRYGSISREPQEWSESESLCYGCTMHSGLVGMSSALTRMAKETTKELYVSIV